MSAILSSDDLNDFISPGVACIKPVETIPRQEDSVNPYEVTTEDKIQQVNAPPASISLTDCLACSGCVTSAEAVLVSLQSHSEVLNILDSYPAIDPVRILNAHNGDLNGYQPTVEGGKLFVASVSPQVRASLAATYGITEDMAGNLIDQLLRGTEGLRSGGRHNSSFSYVVDTNVMRQACQVLSVDEALNNLASPTRPILSSACPGWICYAEKTHPHVLPHISKLKSPQALTGTLLKSVLARTLNIHPSQIWHLALMPCFDKKLEASREELTNRWWQETGSIEDTQAVRDVDCVITTRELLALANERGISIQELPKTQLIGHDRPPFPDEQTEGFLFPNSRIHNNQSADAGTSGGYMYHILCSAQLSNPGSSITVSRGRNADVTDYVLLSSENKQIMKCARFYGFRNIQNLVRKLKPARASRLPGAARRAPGAPLKADSAMEYTYVEVMACPGGCTNGGGQMKPEDVKEIYMSDVSRGSDGVKASPQLQREWLKQVDEAYYSAGSDSEREPEDETMLDTSNHDVIMEDSPPPNASIAEDLISGIFTSHVHDFLGYWSQLTGIPLNKLAFTTYRKVESDVGKSKGKSTGDMERIAGLASSIGGGW